MEDDDAVAVERLRVHLAMVQRVADLGTWEADVRTEEVTWSSDVHRMLGGPDGIEPGDVAFLEAVHPEDRHRVAQALADVLEGRMAHPLEHRIVRPDGAVRHVHHDVLTEEEDGQVVRLLGTIQDITDQTALTRSLLDTESRRRELLHRLVRDSEHERAQLAGDLHDGPIQVLTVTAMRLEHLRMVEPDTPAWLAEAVDAVRNTVVQLRDVLVELHPRAGAGDGLDATLTQLALTVVPDLDVEVEVRGVATGAESRAVFGIVQEALWDVRERHGAQNLDIFVDVGDDGIDLTLTGGRADAEPFEELLSRAGLLGVRERTEGVGGRCTVVDDDGSPAVHCHLPRAGDEVVVAHG
jgi:PAS domain S-box-containing protein